MSPLWMEDKRVHIFILVRSRRKKISLTFMKDILIKIIVDTANVGYFAFRGLLPKADNC